MPVFIQLPNGQRINIDIIESYQPVDHDDAKTIIKFRSKEPVVIPFSSAVIDKLIINATALNKLTTK